MLDFALSFYQNYQWIFYILITIVVILEGPIVILTLTFLSSPLGIPLPIILLFAIVGDIGGDVLHFLIGKYAKKQREKLPIKRDTKKLQQLNKKIENYPLLEKLIIIKYTPPITSPGLIYLGSSSLKFKDFFKTTLPLCLISSGIVFSTGLFFGKYFTSKENTLWLIIGIGIIFLLLTKNIKRIGNFIIKKIEEKHLKDKSKN